MITKIISGCQTGSDQAALDVAIELGIPHGGWIPKGRVTEEGRLPAKYHLKEMPTTSYPKRTEQNVIDSDGTLIVSHGPLTGGSAFTEQMAEKHGRPCLHIDLNKTKKLQAAQNIESWITEHNIKILNVAGSRASKDPKIYQATKSILKTVFHLSVTEESSIQKALPMSAWPKTVDEAVAKLVEGLPLREKTRMANLREMELTSLAFSVGLVIKNEFGLWDGNEELIKSCQLVSGTEDLHPDDAAAVIIKELWKKLRETHSLRAVK
jgi:hypothetical protein